LPTTYRRRHNMYKFLLIEICKPIIRRAGTAMGSALVGLGIASEQALQLETASISLLLVLADLILSHLERNKP
jgi:hypothetical protein